MTGIPLAIANATTNYTAIATTNNTAITISVGIIFIVGAVIAVTVWVLLPAAEPPR